METARLGRDRAWATFAGGPGNGPARACRDQPVATAFRADPADNHDEEDPVATTYNGYCVKCKEKRDFEGNIEVSKTGMNMAKGKCPTCGTTINRILGKAEVKA
jgi:hypothetical protein